MDTPADRVEEKTFEALANKLAYVEAKKLVNRFSETTVEVSVQRG